MTLIIFVVNENVYIPIHIFICLLSFVLVFQSRTN